MWKVRSKRSAENDSDAQAIENVSWGKILDESQCLVFGKVSKKLKLLIVGEELGDEEDEQRSPFGGRAGVLLDQMLMSCGLGLDDFNIVNLIKLQRSVDGSQKQLGVDPRIEFLVPRIQIWDPVIVLALGKTVARTFLECKEPLAELRGKIHYDNITGVPLIVTYHPAYLLRSPKDKAKSWVDLNLIKKMVKKEPK